MLGALFRAAARDHLGPPVTGFLRSRGGKGLTSGVRRASDDEHVVFYRQAPKVTRYQLVVAEGLSSFMWFWILWHVWHNFDSLLGHFPYPDASEWTDEELGIPPDDEE